MWQVSWKNIRKARQGTDFSTDATGEVRDWGGVNLIVGDDWLQLPPVCAKSIFRIPFLKDYNSVERRILNMFWQMEDVKGIPSRPELLFELTEQLRSKDSWLNYVLSCDRLGSEPWEVYCFTHGLPTRHVGSWLPGRDVPLCGNIACQKV